MFGCFFFVETPSSAGANGGAIAGGIIAVLVVIVIVVIIVYIVVIRPRRSTYQHFVLLTKNPYSPCGLIFFLLL
jgi:hypothetical protein